MKPLLWVGLVLVVVSCKKSSTVAVECSPKDRTVDCLVEHQSGDAPAKVCWTTTVKCPTVETYVDELCRDVEAHQKLTVPLDLPSDPRFRNCDKVLSARVDNIKIR